ncbi:Serine/threonine-protein phosphatase 2 [Pannonibacter phragmitetus]|uniref:Serine/threonine-protein phosphatase 2 n=2 Tax=Pannonibacter phragmitetus TaxID=121719 RepID=A0A378ZT50_9HYPH|nr:Serine/threonine-protein phosphatase 2 [Pannonibacter phragmitetus]
MKRLLAAFNSLLSGRNSMKESGNPRVIIHDDRPQVLYAIGDIHGRLDLFEELEAMILADAALFPGPAQMILLGDLVDRGPASSQILDRMLAPPRGGMERIILAGNHELMMLGFLEDPKANMAWLAHGGQEALFSYGLSAQEIDNMRRSPKTASALLRSYVPEEHFQLLESLPTACSMPGVIFAHAGIRPGVPVSLQNDIDLTRIRGEFLGSTDDYGAIVVHGHTVVEAPEVHPNRIAIDTGAYATGILTALRVTYDGGISFLQTGAGRMSTAQV